MTTPFASIGGLASGLDTGNIVQQLLQLERQPRVAIEHRQNRYRQQNEAWGNVVTRLSSLRTAVDTLNDPAWLSKTSKATSSNDAVVAARATGSAQSGSLSLTVDALARTHQVAFGSSFASSDTVVGEGTITLTRADGATVDVQLGEGASVADAARALDGVDGISARVLRTDTGAHRIVVTANATGEVAGFGLASTIGALDTQQVLTQGQDAQLRIGGLTIARASNTITDLVEGVELQLRGTGDVTVEVAQDVDKAVEQVDRFVEAANGMLSQLAAVGRTSTEASNRGALAGDPLVRSLALRIRGALSQVTGSGDFPTLGSVGLELTRDGRITLDQTKLRAALAADPQAVGAMLGKAGGADDPRVEVTATGRAAPGTYRLQVDTAAQIATATGAVYTPPGPGYPRTFTVSVPGSDPVAITLTDEHDSAAAAVAHINAQLVAAGVTRVKASVEALSETDDAIRFDADRAGSATSFTIDGADAADVGLPTGTFTGQDAAGTLTRGDDSWTLTGSGRSLTATTGDPRGLVLRIPTEVTGDLGDITVRAGLGSVFDALLRTAEGSGGSIARARQAVTNRIDGTKASIERFEDRLEIRERTIRRQFTALESAMAQFNAQASWLTSQLGSMMTP